VAIIEVTDLRKTYNSGDVSVNAVDGATFEIEKGEISIIVGHSGAGKTTILNILGGMDVPTSGKVVIEGKDIAKRSKKHLALYRRHSVGFVFQFYNLIQNLTVLENVELAAQICKYPLDPLDVLRDVGLEHRIKNFPSQLSGGEQQRVSIARSLAKKPKLMLCDEPTGALDYNTGKSILQLLQKMSQKYEMTVILITHNMAIAPMGNRVITVKSGKIEKIVLNDSPASIERIEW
jgi:putative ABC transport system ATP-binding protein